MINIQETSQITKIYLVTNCYGDPNKVYIGKTKACRKNDHKRTYGKDIRYDYIDQINSLDYKDWKPLETFWIQYFKYLGFNVLNLNNGGAGSLYASDETKEKLRKANTGRVKSKETRLKLSQSHKGKKQSKDTIDKRKIHIVKPVNQYSMDGILIKRWNSIIEAQNNLFLHNITFSCKNNNKSCGGFIWRYDGDIFNYKPKIKGKRVLQYDTDGNLLKIWDNIIIAKNNTGSKDISLCCMGKINHSNNFIWRYENSPLKSDYKFPKYRKSIPIYQYTINNEFIKQWDCISEINDLLNIKNCCISSCCRGKQKTAGGYKWSYIKYEENQTKN